MQHKKLLSTYVYIFEYYQFAANLIMGICLMAHEELKYFEEGSEMSQRT